jgi:ribosomal protein RSM22 (predicted rRNA methylase)
VSATIEGALSGHLPRLLAAFRQKVRSRAEGPLTTEERRLVLRGIEALSRGLTRSRPLAHGEVRYLEQDELLAAYLLFYWPVSYAQAREVLREVGAPVGRVLDLGSGPGPMAAAALDAGANEVWALDGSSRALQTCAALLAGCPLHTRRWDPLHAPEIPSGTFDTILIGHLLNELDVGVRQRLVSRTLSHLSPGGHLLIIEPALRETSRSLLELRDRLIASKEAVVVAPCLRQEECPALRRPSDWCHAERRFFPPMLVEELSRAAALHREALKMTYLVLRSQGEPPVYSPDLFRVVSEPMLQKGQFRRYGCGPVGRHSLVLQVRDRSDENRPFEILERGDVVRLTDLQKRGDGLRVTSASLVERVAAAGEPPPPPTD